MLVNDDPYCLGESTRQRILHWQTKRLPLIREPQDTEPFVPSCSLVTLPGTVSSTQLLADLLMRRDMERRLPRLLHLDFAQGQLSWKSCPDIQAEKRVAQDVFVLAMSDCGCVASES